MPAIMQRSSSIKEVSLWMDSFYHNKQERGAIIKVYVKLFGMIAAGAGYREKEFDLPSGTKVKELLDLMDLPVKTEWIVVSINGIVKQKTTVLIENDNVYILPVGGGG